MRKFVVRDADGIPTPVSEETYIALVGERDIAPFVVRVRREEIGMDDVPEEDRERVAVVLAAREQFSGPYKIPPAKALAELREVLA